MMLTIRDAFDLPSPEDLTALGFVVRLSDVQGDEVVAKLVHDYVLTPKVKEELPGILRSVHTAIERREDYGRFVLGSFGSGKSHFMTMLGLLAEDHEAAWKKVTTAIPGLDAEHRQWMADARILVVRIHMLTMSRSGPDAGFDRAVFDSFNEALTRRGKEPVAFVHVDGVLDEARREASDYGDAFWRKLELAGVVGSREDFEALAQGSGQEREDLARAYLEWKGRDPASAGLNPNFAEGLQHLATHAKSQGFGAVLFLIDELLLWLGEKQTHEFRQAINQLNTIVDHSDGQRAIPLVCFFAKQRNIREFFPDMVQEDALHQHIDHHSKRFEPMELRDVELRHICKERVLKRRRPQEVQAVVDSLAREHKNVLPAVLQHADVGYLQDVYPFHPALIEMLIDVSSLMQRERTALRLLYELLVNHYPNLELGKLLPVGCAFDALFPEGGVEGSKRTADLKSVHQLFYVRFKPGIAAMAKESGPDFDEARQHTLEQIIKTALLAEVSTRLKGQSLTVERLVRLNDADVAAGELDRTRMSMVFQDLVDLSRKVPALQVTGTGKSAIVGITLQGVNFDEILNRARSRVENEHARRKTFFSLLKEALQLQGKKGFTEAEGNDGTYVATWRKTDRKGSVAIGNVRELSYNDFKPKGGEEFRILIDFPWDQPGHTVEEDRQKADKVRRSEGRISTICWLPRHFSANELAVLQDLAACELVTQASADDDLFGHLSPTDRQSVQERANRQATTLKNNLAEKLKDIYKDSAEAIALIDGVDSRVPEREDLGKNLEEFARALLDRQYPEHPAFAMEPKPDALRTLCDWMVDASERPGDWFPFDDKQGKILRMVGLPFEVAEVGERKARLRLDTRYIKTVLEKAAGDSVSWEDIDGALEKRFGLLPACRNLFLVFLTRAQSYRVLKDVTGEPEPVEIDNRPRVGLRLQRAPVLELPEWVRVRDLAQSLFGLPAPSEHRSLGEQDRVTGELKKAAEDRRRRLQAVHEQIAKLVPSGEHLAELKLAIAGLAPLAMKEEPSKLLRAFLSLWPDDATAPRVLVMKNLKEVESALAALDATSQHLLETSSNHAMHGANVQAHLEVLREIIGSSEVEHRLTTQAIHKWNKDAKALLAKVLRPPSVPPPPVPPPVAPPVPPPPPPLEERIAVIKDYVLCPQDGNAMTEFMRGLRDKLQSIGDGEFDVEVTVKPKKEPS
jgi:hypothetical protein